MEEIRDIVQVMMKLGKLLPEGGTEFVFSLLFKSDVRNIVLRSNALGLFLRGAIGGFEPNDKEILIDLDGNWKQYAKAIERCHGLKKVEESEAVLFALLHELGHSLNGSDEGKADHFAIQNFRKFKKAQADGRK